VHEQQPHHQTVSSWTWNWISVPSLKRVPNNDVLVADAASETRRRARTNARAVPLFITPLTSKNYPLYTERFPRFHAGPRWREEYSCGERGAGLAASIQAGRIEECSRERGGEMGKDASLEKLSIYIPQKKIGEKPVERLIKLGQKRDRSVNYLVVEAILQYVQREENEN
jgi:hypothetical protein